MIHVARSGQAGQVSSHGELSGSDPVLNVCLASPLFPPEYSGGAMRFFRYAPGLRSRSVEMHVVAAELGAWKRYRRFSGNHEDTVVHAAAEDMIRIPVQRVPVPRVRLPARAERWLTRWTYEAAVVARCRDAAARPDLLIWRYPLTLGSMPALRRLRRMGVPMMRVITMFDDPARTTARQRLRQSLQHVPYRLLDCVVVGSATMRDNLRRLGVRTRIEVIPHGVDLGRFRPAASREEAAPLRSALGVAPDAELVLFAGPVEKRKGLDYLAAAWDRIAASRPGAWLVIAGPERESSGGQADPFSTSLRATLQGGRGAERVIFAGRVANLEEFMRAADLFVFPSRQEGMPNVVCEAMASGLPCVLTPFLGLPAEFGRPGEQYALAQHDAASLAESIVALLADDNARAGLGAAARRWTEAHLDLELALDQYACLCRELAVVRT
jgi:glycosyltransferase involved in cell wall biosynthesis